VIAAVKALPPDRPIYTNARAALYILASRRSSPIPKKVHDKTSAPRAAYRDELARMERDLEARHGVVVYFTRLGGAWDRPPEQELVRALGLRRVYKSPEGGIYEIAPRDSLR
jgi:hypothetical protein